MIAAESSTSIARPAAEVFEFVSDVRNDPRWHTDILEAHLTGEGPIGIRRAFLERWIAHREHVGKVRPKTAKTYRMYVARHVTPAIGHPASQRGSTQAPAKGH